MSNIKCGSRWLLFIAYASNTLEVDSLIRNFSFKNNTTLEIKGIALKKEKP